MQISLKKTNKQTNKNKQKNQQKKIAINKGYNTEIMSKK